MALRRDARGRVISKTIASMRQCARCGVWKRIGSFSRTGPGGRYVAAYCKACYAERSRSYYRRNRARISRKDRRKYRNDPAYRRNRLRQAKRRHERRREAVLDLLGRSCRRCGSEDDLHVHHTDGDGDEHRREVGGSSTGVYGSILRGDYPEEQLEVLCRSCHTSHHEPWLARKEK